MTNAVVIAKEMTHWERWKADHAAGMAHLTECFAQGMSLQRYAAELGIAVSTLHEYITTRPSLAEEYARARELRADYWAELIAAEADTPVRRTDKGNLDPADVARKRLKVDALKWVASKFAPRKYGDKLEVEATVKHDAVGELREYLQGKSRIPVRSKTTLESDVGGNPLVKESR